MNLKVYYASIREAAAKIPGEYAVIVSLPTPDGGKAGVMTEVSRDLAAQMVVEKRARVASDEESAAFYQQQRESLRKAEEDAARQKLPVAVLSAADLESLIARPERKK